MPFVRRAFVDSMPTAVVSNSRAGIVLAFCPADRRTESLFVTGLASRVPADLARRALRKLEYVHVAARLDDLRVPPGNRLHALKGDRKGQHAIAVNDQWRICRPTGARHVDVGRG